MFTKKVYIPVDSKPIDLYKISMPRKNLTYQEQMFDIQHPGLLNDVSYTESFKEAQQAMKEGATISSYSAYKTSDGEYVEITSVKTLTKYVPK